MRGTLAAALIGLYLIRFDFWFWHSPGSVLGLPVGLLYHVSYCFIVAIVLGWSLRRTWNRPEDLGRTQN